MILELRNYHVDPTRRQEFIDHFEEQLVHTQEAAGMGVLGQFTVIGASDRFVWIRTFADMAARRMALRHFYGGPVWERHGPLANEIMSNVDDVLLLRPAATSPDPAAGYRPDPAAPPGTRQRDRDLMLVGVTTLPDDAAELGKQAAADLQRVARDTGVREVGRLVTEQSPNDFPRLPVRQDPDTFVWLVSASRSADVAQLGSALRDAVGRPARLVALEPTRRSFLPDGSRTTS